MRQLIDYNPLTKEKTWFVGGGATGFQVVTEQDCQRVVDFTQRMANDPNYKRQGIKDDWYHFARVPNTVLLDIQVKYGLDWSKSDDLPKIERIIKRDYKKLLTVDKV